MPSGFDLHRYTTDFNPIAGGPFVSIQDVMSAFGDVFQEVIALFPKLVQLLESLTPEQILQVIELGLTTFLPQFLKELFPTDGTTSPLITAVVDALGGGSAGGVGNIVPQLISIAVVLIPQLGLQIAQVLTNPGNLLAGFTGGGTTLLAQLINAGGGTGSTLGDFTSLFGGLGSLQTLFTGFTGGTPLLTQLISAGGGNTAAPSLLTEFTNIFGGGGSGLPAAFTTGLNTSVSLLSQLPSVLTWPLSSLGVGTLPAGIGLGSLGQVPGLSGLLSGLDTSGATTLLTQLPSLLSMPLSAIPALVTLFGGLGTSTSLLSQLANVFFNTSGSTNSTLGQGGSNLLALLGNPTGLLSGGFSPVAAGGNMLQQVLTPAGALTSLTQLPRHLFGSLTSTAGQNSNLLADADPGFSNPASLAGQGLWTLDTTVDHTGIAGSGSAKTTANGTQIGLTSVPIAATANQPITLSAYVRWTGVSAAAGQAISLIGMAYDSNDNPLNGTGTVVASVTTPGAASSAYTGADAGGWVNLMSGFQAPTGTAYVRLSIRVGSNMVAGNVWVDDLSMSIAGFIDATALFNFENMAEGIIPGPAMQGFQGLVNIFESFGHLVDGLGTAASGNSQSGLDFSQLFAFIQDLSIQADQGGSQGTINTNILGFRQNKTLAAGMHPTSESMFPLTSFGTGGAMATTSLAAGQAIGQPFRAAEVAQKGFFEFIAAGTGLTNILTNIYTVNPSTGAHTLLWGSTDQSSLVPSTLGHVKVSIPLANQPTVNAGQNLLLEIVNNGSAALTLVTKSTGQPTHPTDYPFNIGTTRTLASTGGASPTSLTNAQVARTSNTPYINLGISATPSTYVPPNVQDFGSNGTWNRPGGFVDGDIVDYFALGCGGGGQSGGYGAAGWGGQAGQWATGSFVIGSDPHGTGLPVLPNSTTTLAIAFGAIGRGGVNPYTLQPGSAGGVAQISGAGISTITAAGGLGGGAGFTGDNTNGQGAGNRTIGAYTAYGGPETAMNAAGPGQPGGGGSSGYPAFGNDGGNPHVWIRTRQWGTQ